jgi:ribose 5-phosphate isomerase B
LEVLEGVMKIAVGCDHAGYEGPGPLYKESIVKRIEELGHEVVDCGTHGAGAVDYPDYAQKVCEAILGGEAECGVLMCGTGVGMGMAANRNKGIRAATCATVDMARLAREHNKANVLCVGRRVLSLARCLELLDVFLVTPFSEGERHKRRVEKMG